MSDIELIKAEIERMHQEAVLAACGNDTDWLRSRIGTCVDILAFIDSLPEDKPSEDVEDAARYSEILTYPMPDDGDIEKVMQVQEARIFHEIGFKAGAEWQRIQMPMPEDTVIFMKGVEEGRRLEREDRNDDKLPRYYGD